MRKLKKQTGILMAAVLGAAAVMTGCGQSSTDNEQSAMQESSVLTESAAEELSAGSETAAESETEEETASETEEAPAASETDEVKTQADENAPEIPGLTYTSTMELTYAQAFQVYYYEGGYKLLSVPESADYLIVPEGAEAPADLDEDITVLQQPLDEIYLAATASMALFDALDGLDAIKFSGTNADGWYIESAKKALEDGTIIYAGKYSEPDYELLLGDGCDLAVESTMILHTPKVQEMLETLGIPVFIDRSSYESHPLGRTEWIKAYGAMLNKEEEAEAFFDEQAKVIEEIETYEKTGQKVAIFYINTSGGVVVRNTTDYMAKMIELGGATYAFQNLGEITSSSSVEMTMEEFYNQAVDADYLIYNTSIDTSVKSLADMLAKNELLADFTAVKNDQVWMCGNSFYQATDTVGQMILDVNRMLTGGSEEDMVFLQKLS